MSFAGSDDSQGSSGPPRLSKDNVKLLVDMNPRVIQGVLSFLWFKDSRSMAQVCRRFRSMSHEASVHADALDTFLKLLDRSNDHLIKHSSPDYRILHLLSRRLSTWPTAVDDKSFGHPDGPNGASVVDLGQPHRKVCAEVQGQVGTHSCTTGCNSLVANDFFPCIFGLSTLKARWAASWDPVCLHVSSSGIQLSCAPFTRNLNVDGVQVSSLTCIAYFEVAIRASASATAASAKTQECGSAVDNARRGISVGLANPIFPLRDRRPGMDNSSFGYFSGDGKLYHGKTGVGLSFGPTFGAGDTIGCGVVYPPLAVDNGVIFFTRNGQIIGMVELPDAGMLGVPWFPVVGLEAAQAVKFNFGDESFLFNVSEFEYDEVLLQSQQQAAVAAGTGMGSKRKRCTSSSSSSDEKVQITDMQERYYQMCVEQALARARRDMLSVHPRYTDPYGTGGGGGMKYGSSASSTSSSSSSSSSLLSSSSASAASFSSRFLDEEVRAVNLREIEMMRQISAWGKDQDQILLRNTMRVQLAEHGAVGETVLGQGGGQGDVPGQEQRRGNTHGQEYELLHGGRDGHGSSVHSSGIPPPPPPAPGSMGARCSSAGSLSFRFEHAGSGSYRGSWDPLGGIGDSCGGSVASRTSSMAVAGRGVVRAGLQHGMGLDGQLGMCRSYAWSRGSGTAGSGSDGRSNAARMDPRGAACVHHYHRSAVPAAPAPAPANVALNVHALCHRDLLLRAAGALTHGRSMKSGDAAVAGSGEDEEGGDDDQRSIATSLLVEVASVDDEGSYFGYGTHIESEDDDAFADDVLSGSYEADIDARGNSRQAESRGRKKRRLKPGDACGAQWTDGDGYDAASEMGQHTDGRVSDGGTDGDIGEDGSQGALGFARAIPLYGRIHASLGSFAEKSTQRGVRQGSWGPRDDVSSYYNQPSP